MHACSKQGERRISKLPRFYGDYAAAFVAALLVLCILIFSITMNSTTSVSAVEARGVGVYWDSNCSNRVSSIDWGTFNPGSVKNVAVYIRNEEEGPMYLIMSTRNWSPPNTSEYLNLGWNYTLGRRMNPGEALQITLTLTVSRYIQGISSFSFEILVAGSDSLPGDIDSDGDVDFWDLLTFCKAYGSYPGHAKWNPNCDFNCNNKVDFEDLRWLCRNYGKTD